MAKVGNWGTGLRFEVSGRKVQTFQSMSHVSKYRTATHSMAAGKPRVEFLGADLETAQFSMKLSAPYCKHPIQVEEKLRSRARNGYYAPLVVGGRRILKRAMIESISTSYDVVWKNGKIYSMKIDVSMKEYN